MISQLCRTCALLLTVMLSAAGWAQEHRFLRFTPGEEEWQGRLETSITRYENNRGQLIDLVAAIHIADPGYYDALNKYFTTFDVVLYELVTDEEALPDSLSQASTGSGIGFMQASVARFLNLQFQLSGIDYQQGNFVRADLSAQELSEIMASKDETFFSMFLKMAMAQLAAEQDAIANQNIQPSTLTIMRLITALSAENQAGALKFLLAQELGRSGDLALSPELESQLTILGDRNAVALQAINRALTSGENRIALFYGAAHMPGIERELLQTLGFSEISRQWLVAWDIPQ